jgi:hypothetical protein
MFVYSDKHCLLIGGGSKSAIRIEDNFHRGECGVSETFNNELLSDQSFTIKNFEIWGISE